MITLTQPRLLIPKLETALIFLLAFAIFISKPLIYLSILLLIGSTLVRITNDQEYRHELFGNKLFWASTGLFVFGVVSVAIGSSYVEDIGWMAKKTMMLPMVAPLLIAFNFQYNRLAALSGVIIGFWTAFILTASMHNWTWDGSRYGGATWDVGMWGVVCAMLIVLLMPMIFFKNLSITARCILVLTIMGAGFMLLASGSRGPLLGAAIAIFFYLILKQRIALLLLGATTLIGALTANIIFPQQASSTIQRIKSITDLDNDASNYIRLALWENGFALLKKQFMVGDKRFWLGNGHQGKIVETNEFFHSEFKYIARVKPGALEELHPNVADQHNMYLDSTLSSGILWTASVLVFISLLGISKKKIKSEKHSPQISFPMLIYFTVNGLTYSILPHFAFMMTLFFIALMREVEE